eukprot:gene5717-7112_t
MVKRNKTNEQSTATMMSDIDHPVVPPEKKSKKSIPTNNTTTNLNNNKKQQKNTIKTTTTTPKSTPTTTTNTNTKSNNLLPYEKLLKSVIDSYISPSIDSINHSRDTFLETKTLLPNIILLLHQNQCLKQCLASSNSKIKDKWLEVLNLLLKQPSSATVQQQHHHQHSSSESDLLWIGIHLLCETIRVCDYDLLVLKMDSWISTLSSLVTQHKKFLQQQDQQQKSISFKEYGSIIITISILIEKSSKWNDLRRSITSQSVMSQLTTVILTSLDPSLGFPVECKIDSLVAISSLIDTVSTALKPYLGKIESYCYPLLYHCHKSIQESASSVIAKLHQCVGINTTDLYWDIVIQKILTQMNLIVDQLYEGLEEDEQDENGRKIDRTEIRKIVLPGSNKLNNLGDDQVMSMLKHLSNVPFPSPPSTSTKDQSALHYQRGSFHLKGFQGLSHCLIKLLSTHTITPCPIPLDEIIKLLCRILNVNTQHLHSLSIANNFSISQMMCFISTLHELSFTILSNMLKVPLRSRLTLSPQLHTEVYKTIKDVIESFGSSCYESLAIPLVPLILNDIQPYIPEQENSANTIISSATSSNTSCKNINYSKRLAVSASVEAALNKQTIVATIGNVDPTLIQDYSSISIKSAALKALESMLLHCDQLLVSLLLECHSLSTIKKGTTYYTNSSYYCWEYRRGLYKCLLNCVLKPISTLPPILPYAIRLFTIGMNTDYHPKVRSICAKGVSICESLIHPQSPGLVSSTTDVFASLDINNNSFKKLRNQYLVQQQNESSPLFQASEDEDDVLFNLNHHKNHISLNGSGNVIEEEDEDEDEDDDDEEDEKLDISFNGDELMEDDEDEEEVSTTTKITSTTTKSSQQQPKTTTTTTTTKSSATSTTTNSKNQVMKTSLFDSSLLKVSEVSNDKKSKKVINEPPKSLASKVNNVDDEDDDDLPDIIDDPPSD